MSELELKNKHGIEFRDGVNANKIASDYVKNNITIDNNVYKAKMKKGGGFVIIL